MLLAYGSSFEIRIRNGVYLIFSVTGILSRKCTFLTKNLQNTYLIRKPIPSPFRLYVDLFSIPF